MNFSAYIGQSIEVEDPTALYQCMDWAFKVCDLLAIPRSAIRNPLAREVWDNHDAGYFTQSPTPINGCFAIWGAAVGPAGHIAWVESGTAQNFTSLDQNWNFVQSVQRINHTGFGVLGFLIPKGINVLSRQQVIDQFVGFGKGQPTETQIQFYMAHDYGVLNGDLLTDTWNRLNVSLQAEGVLKAQLDAATGTTKPGTVLAPGEYLVK